MGEVQPVVLSIAKTLRRHLGQAEQATRRLLAVGDVERVEQVQTLHIVVEQRIWPAALVGAFGEDARALVAEQQRHPAAELHMLVEYIGQRAPEIWLVQPLGELPESSVPGDVQECQFHACTPRVS